MGDTGLPSLQVNETRLMGTLFCLYLAASVAWHFAYMSHTYRIHHGLYPVGYVLRTRLRPPRIPPTLFPLSMAAFATAALAYGLLAQHIYGLTALALYIAIFPSIRWMHLVHQKSNVCPLVFAVLLLSSEYHAPLFQATPATVAAGTSWPLTFIRILIASVYFTTGMRKMLTTGWRWAQGKTLQWYLLEHYLWGTFERAVPLMRSPTALRTVSTTTILTQLSAPLIIVGGWLPAIHGVLTLGFHLSTHLFMGINFLAFFGPAMVSSAVSYPLTVLAESSLDRGTIEAVVGPLGASPETSAAWQVGLMALVPLTLIYSQFSWRIGFPFGPFKLFSTDYSDFRSLAVLRLELGDESGEYRPWRPFEYYDRRELSHLGYDRRTRTTGLSPHFDARFRSFYWPVIQRDDPETAAALRSIRLVLRCAAWGGDMPVGYDDYAIAMIRVEGGVLSDLQPMTRLHVRSHRFPARGGSRLALGGTCARRPLRGR